MSVLKVLGTALTVTLLASTSAFALTVTNRDTSAHTVYVQQGDNQSEHALPAGESFEANCEEGCILRLAGAEGEMPAENADKLVILDGSIQREQE